MPEQLYQHGNTIEDAQRAGHVATERTTVLEALAEPVEFVSPDRSNRSTPPVNVDMDDQ